jgi:hypothetical protein
LSARESPTNQSFKGLKSLAPTTQSHLTPAISSVARLAMTTPSSTILTSESPGSIPDNHVKTEPSQEPAAKQVDEIQAAEEEERDPDDEDILHGVKLILAFVAMLLSLFLVAIDVVSCLCFRCKNT